ncbi:MAG: PspC domain-containing protein [Candidatus Viridilinea halotolerans]|uniref:PspC domain-containing protein n=1 Tax=Candidatus Viridilinea halotolerans TaxID=2491704 RepID=A0A426UC68_9CHLR|nr:MAG: PspC domain-containing protein [Candidatus Viridilinea halotolerans]
MNQRLVRSANDRMFAGVCGGLAHYFNLDATVLRIVFVVAVLSGVSPLIYLILWILMPLERTIPHQQTPPALEQPNNDPTGEWQYDPYTGERIRKP